MLSTQKIMERFAELAYIPEEDIESHRRLCISAKNYIEKRIKPDTNLDDPDNINRLHSAAAAVAFCEHDVITGRSRANSEEIRVGDISLRSSNREQTGIGNELRDYFLAQVADLIKVDFIPLIQTGETP